VPREEQRVDGEQREREHERNADEESGRHEDHPTDRRPSSGTAESLSGRTRGGACAALQDSTMLVADNGNATSRSHAILDP
jgi:hypothetical protein